MTFFIGKGREWKNLSEPEKKRRIGFAIAVSKRKAARLPERTA